MEQKNLASYLNDEKEVLETGYFYSIFINTKGKKFPLYLSDFIRHTRVEYLYGFDYHTIYDLTAHIPKWQKQFPELKSTDTIYQLILTLNIETSEPEMEKYVEWILTETLIPYLKVIGCEYLDDHYIYLVPDKYKKLGVKNGAKSVTLHTKDRELGTREVIKQALRMTKEERGYLETCMALNGSCTISNCIDEENLPKLMELLNKSNIKYTIE